MVNKTEQSFAAFNITMYKAIDAVRKMAAALEEEQK